MPERKRNIRTVLMPKEKREVITFKVIRKSHIILVPKNIKRDSRNDSYNVYETSDHRVICLLDN